jgi:hypothetical protein
MLARVAVAARTCPKLKSWLPNHRKPRATDQPGRAASALKIRLEIKSGLMGVEELASC